MIKTFGDKRTENLWTEKTSSKWKNIQTVALRKLEQLDQAKNLWELTFPPHNRLEALRGKWKGYYSIRINQQYRLVFIWDKGYAYEVEITDYH
jgi:proteic killer suppression protein